ncbi:MAG: hypothetical protein SPI59_05800 [Finegoldia sp.]|nr:hypothetical protein [Finegoldia sp.]
MILATYQGLKNTYAYDRDRDKFIDQIGYEPIWCFPANNVIQFWICNWLSHPDLPQKLTVFESDEYILVDKIDRELYLNGKIDFDEVGMYPVEDDNFLMDDYEIGYDVITRKVENKDLNVNIVKKFKEIRSCGGKFFNDYLDMRLAMEENQAKRDFKSYSANPEKSLKTLIDENLADLYRQTYINSGYVFYDYLDSINDLVNFRQRKLKVDFAELFYKLHYPKFIYNPDRESLLEVADFLLVNTISFQKKPQLHLG